MKMENETVIQAVIFDFDGTLYDFAHLPRNLIFASPRDMFLMKAERTVRRELKGRDFGSESDFLANFTARMSEVTKKSAQKIDEWYSHRYLETMIRVLSKKYSARRGTAELFKDLHEKGIKIAVFSDYPRVRERMSAIGLGEDVQSLCDGLFCSQEFGSLKPAPRPFIEIAAKLGVSCANCLVVGDRDDTDGDGARQSGMQFFKIESNASEFPALL